VDNTRRIVAALRVDTRPVAIRSTVWLDVCIRITGDLRAKSLLKKCGITRSCFPLERTRMLKAFDFEWRGFADTNVRRFSLDMAWQC
jgi:hypothetical protein